MEVRKKAEYRSSIRSKKLIREAFLELINEKPLEKITVTDIVNRADINRRTFYAHFQDVRALVESIEDETIDKLREVLIETHNDNFFIDPLSQLLKVAEFLESNINFYRIIINSNGAEPFLTKLKSVFTTFMQYDENVPDIIKNTTEFVIMQNFIAGGITNILQMWFRGDTKQSLEELVTAVANLMKASNHNKKNHGNFPDLKNK